MMAGPVVTVCTVSADVVRHPIYYLSPAKIRFILHHVSVCNAMMTFTVTDHIGVKLSIRMDSKDFVSKDFTFYDCSKHHS